MERIDLGVVNIELALEALVTDGVWKGKLVESSPSKPERTGRWAGQEKHVTC